VSSPTPAGCDPAEILALVREFDDAELHASTEGLERLLADDFLSIGERGYVLDKARWIAKFDDFGYLTLETSEIDIRCYHRTAIVRAVRRTRATWRGTPMDISTRVGQVWVPAPSDYRLAAIQFSSLDAA
jgi:hypothetical protein